MEIKSLPPTTTMWRSRSQFAVDSSDELVAHVRQFPCLIVAVLNVHRKLVLFHLIVLHRWLWRLMHGFWKRNLKLLLFKPRWTVVSHAHNGNELASCMNVKKIQTIERKCKEICIRYEFPYNQIGSNGFRVANSIVGNYKHSFWVERVDWRTQLFLEFVNFPVVLSFIYFQQK